MEIQMNELIKIEKSNVGGDLIETVNARELHQFLKVGRDFSTWIKRRIEQYGFEEGVDFCSFLSESTGNRSSKECDFDSPELGNQTSGRGGDRQRKQTCCNLSSPTGGVPRLCGFCRNW